MRNETLGEILTSYRSEARLSTNPALNQNVQAEQIALINKTARDLWTGFDWPHMKIKRDYQLQNGQRFYDITDDFDVTRLYEIKVRDGEDWVKLCNPITDRHYSEYESELDERSWPVVAWKLSEGEQIEVWPVPDQNGTPATLDGHLRVWGMAKLAPMASLTDDRCPLDGDLVAKKAAIETLFAGGNKELAGVRVSEVQALLRALKGNQATKAPPYGMLGVGQSGQAERVFFPRYTTGDAT